MINPNLFGLTETLEYFDSPAQGVLGVPGCTPPPIKLSIIFSLRFLRVWGKLVSLQSPVLGDVSYLSPRPRKGLPPPQGIVVTLFD